MIYYSCSRDFSNGMFIERWDCTYINVYYNTENVGNNKVIINMNLLDTGNLLNNVKKDSVLGNGLASVRNL